MTLIKLGQGLPLEGALDAVILEELLHGDDDAFLQNNSALRSFGFHFVFY